VSNISATNFLLSIDSKIIKYGLDRTIRLLDICNNPHHHLKSIQLIGTNGKGSTASMIANVLTQNGYSVGLYTSPHLVTVNERIKINNKPISNDFMDQFIFQYKDDLISLEASFFEIITVMALCYFVDNQIDFAILETGLGGRLDSVTAAQADVLVYTPIDIDHTSILGNSLKSIAQEKAGAINKNTTFIFSSIQHPEVKKTLNTQAKNFNKKIIYNSKPNIDHKKFSTIHQTQNASLAKLVLDNLSKSHNMQLFNITKHLHTTFWPGRIQFIQTTPDIIFDVSHNNHGIRAFINYFLPIQNKYKTKYIILGFESGKQIAKSIKDLYAIFDNIIITETKIRHSMQADEMIRYHNTSYQSSIIIEKNPILAIEESIKKLEKEDVLVILGSHYFGPYISTLFKNIFDIK